MVTQIPIDNPNASSDPNDPAANVDPNMSPPPIDPAVAASGAQTASYNPQGDLNTPPAGSPAAIPVIHDIGRSTPIPRPVTPMTAGQAAQATADVLESRKEAAADKAAADSEEGKKEAAARAEESAAGKASMEDTKHWQDAYKTMHEANMKTDAASVAALNQYKEDPDHWWNHKDTGGKIAAVIGLMAGGVGQGLQMWGPHGNKQAHNYAIDAIDEAIKNDIDSQKENQRNKFMVYKEQHALHDTDENFAKFKILDSQTQYVLAQKVALSKIAQAAAEAKDPIAQANLKDQQAQLQQQIVNEERAWGQHNEAQANSVRSQLIEQQKAELAHQRELEKLREGEKAKAEGETAKALIVSEQEAPAKAHEAALNRIEKARTALQRQQDQAHSYLPWTTKREKQAQEDLDALDKEEKKADEAFLNAQKAQYGNKSTTPTPESPSGLPNRK